MQDGAQLNGMSLKVNAFISNAYVQRWFKYNIILKKKNNNWECFKVSRAAVTSQPMVAGDKEEKHNTINHSWRDQQTGGLAC